MRKPKPNKVTTGKDELVSELVSDLLITDTS